MLIEFTDDYPIVYEFIYFLFWTIFDQSIEFNCYLNSCECDFQDEFTFDCNITHEFIYLSVR